VRKEIGDLHDRGARRKKVKGGLTPWSSLAGTADAREKKGRTATPSKERR